MFRWNRTLGGVLSVFLILYLSLADVPSLAVSAAAQDGAGLSRHQQNREYDMPPPGDASSGVLPPDGSAGSSSSVRGPFAMIERGVIPYLHLYGKRGLTDTYNSADAENVPEAENGADADGVSEAEYAAGTGELPGSGRISVPFSAVPEGVNNVNIPEAADISASKTASGELSVTDVADSESEDEQSLVSPAVAGAMAEEDNLSEEGTEENTASEEISEDISEENAVSEVDAGADTGSEEIAEEDTASEEDAGADTGSEEIAEENTASEEGAGADTVPEVIAEEDTASEEDAGADTVSEEFSEESTAAEEDAGKDTGKDTESVEDTEEDITSEEGTEEDVVFEEDGEDAGFGEDTDDNMPDTMSQDPYGFEEELNGQAEYVPEEVFSAEEPVSDTEEGSFDHSIVFVEETVTEGEADLADEGILEGEADLADEGILEEEADLADEGVLEEEAYLADEGVLEEEALEEEADLADDGTDLQPESVLYSEENLPEEILPEETLSEEILSEEILSEEILSEEALSEEAASEETVSEEALSGQLSASGEITGTVVPDEETPGLSAPARNAEQKRTSAVQVKEEAAAAETAGTDAAGTGTAGADAAGTGTAGADAAGTGSGDANPSGTGLAETEAAGAGSSLTDPSGDLTSEADASENDSLEVDRRAALKGMSLSLTDRIGVVVYVAADDTVEDDDYIEFICSGEIMPQTVAEAGSSEITDSTGEKIDVLAFELSLGSRQMTDDVAVHMVVDGVSGSEESFSVRSYADQILEGDFPDGEKELIRAMLNYGAYSQEYFGYNTEEPANKGLFDPVSNPDPVINTGEDEWQELLSPYTYTIEEIGKPYMPHWSFIGGLFGYRDLSPQIRVSLILGDEISLVYYYQWYWYYYDLLGSSSHSLAHNQESLTKRARLVNSDSQLEFGNDGNRGYVRLSGIMPYEMNKIYEFTVACGENGEWTMTHKYSPFSVCSEIIRGKEAAAEEKNLYKSMYYYWLAASSVRNGN